MQPESFELTIEQQFSLASMETAAANASPEQLRLLLVSTTRLAMVRQNIIKDLSRRALGNMPCTHWDAQG